MPIRAYSLQVGVSAVIANRMVDGKIYGLPCEVAPMAIFYSMDAFAEAGLTERDLPKTWDMDGR
ncbi:MAG: extracellular solute-binding protein, partial [Roseiarcus sp.]